MINTLLALLIVSIFSVDFLRAEFTWVPRLLGWAPEMLAGLLLAVVALGGERLRIPPKYLIWGLLMLMLITIGVIINEVQPGAIFYGVRKYFRCLPVLLVPLAYRFSDRELKFQTKFLLTLALLQLLPALYQRLFIYPTTPTGDVVVGTVMGPAQLSILLVSTLSVLTAFYLRRSVSLPAYLIMACVLAVPTFINETTATMVLLPMAVVVPVLLSGNLKDQRRRLLPALGVLILLVTAFVVSYNAQFERWGGNPLGLITGGGVEYIYRGADSQSRADEGLEQSEIGRADSFILPFIVLDDPVQWFVGVGIGNASSVFHEVLEGDFSETADRYGASFTTVSVIIWEVGLIGLIMSLIFIWMVFKDARTVSRTSGFRGCFALGWSSVMLLLCVVFLYKNVIDNTVTSFLIVLFCGHVIAMRSTLLIEFDAAMRSAGLANDPT